MTKRDNKEHYVGWSYSGYVEEVQEYRQDTLSQYWCAFSEREERLGGRKWGLGRLSGGMAERVGGAWRGGGTVGRHGAVIVARTDRPICSARQAPRNPAGPTALDFHRESSWKAEAAKTGRHPTGPTAGGFSRAALGRRTCIEYFSRTRQASHPHQQRLLSTWKTDVFPATTTSRRETTLRLAERWRRGRALKNLYSTNYSTPVSKTPAIARRTWR